MDNTVISIIVAIHNQLNVNQIFWDSLKKYTKNKFELIIIDNASTDGSAEFFESIGARVIRNKYNYSYPYSQNQGIAIAKYDWLAFMNNDLIVSPEWDARILESMEVNKLEVATVCGVEHIETVTATKKLKRRWNRIKTALTGFGHSKTILRLMHKWMYPNWEKFINQRYKRFKHQIIEGFVGNTVMVSRGALDKIGLWDERIQAADFDLYLRTKKREIEFNDLRTVHICLDVFIHHYIRLTTHAKPPRFADADNLMPMEAKWGENYLLKFPKR